MKSTTFRAWLLDALEADQIRELTQYGAAAGFPGLTYYADTVALYERFTDEIWDALTDDAGNFGQASALVYAATLNRAEHVESALVYAATLNGAEHVESDHQFKNLLVWYMAERTAMYLVEEWDEPADEE
jgi:hypothetical protein